jgi:putative ABC transport system substrate-binding protein
MRKDTVLFMGTIFTIGVAVVLATTLLWKPTSVRVVTVGIVQWTTADAYTDAVASFKHALVEHGFEEGVHIVYVEKNAHGDARELAAMMDQLIGQRVDLVYTLGAEAARIAKERTEDVPIVFSFVTHPVETGLIFANNYSGNNLVGVRDWVPAGKQLSAFLQMFPAIKSVGFLAPAAEPDALAQRREFEKAAAVLRVRLVYIPITSTVDMLPALQTTRANVDSLYLACGMLSHAGSEGVFGAFARQELLPSFSCHESGVVGGAMVGTVPDAARMGRFAGDKAVKILRGAHPSELETAPAPVSKILINRETVSILDIHVPPLVAASAVYVSNVETP